MGILEQKKKSGSNRDSPLNSSIDKRIMYDLRLFVYFVPSLSLYTKSNAHWVSTSRPSLSLSYSYIHKKLWSVDLLICEYGRKAYARGSVLWLWWRSIWFEGYFHIRCSFLQSPLNFVIWVYPCLWEVSWLLITCV